MAVATIAFVDFDLQASKKRLDIIKLGFLRPISKTAIRNNPTKTDVVAIAPLFSIEL